ncbi:DUF4350 domain-containing protein [Flammeovirga sp. SJP92]|uniref:DUF4350 domain-containing protein n=1 Tax=Flammeovirga sp. SJP92 TaxID=1775430 RepID=UPI0007895A88|nr:DUF4350 domain-containing protein [Flammeovirga sp. SJP92]KXX68732.1 hypothetical protein AVL50_18850 [Flammeovirga sp. SJP92]
MKKFNKQYIILVVAFGLYLFLTLSSEEQTNWNAHFKSDSKDPYGTKALMELLKDPDMKMAIEPSRKTVYELYGQNMESRKLLIVGGRLKLDKESINAIYNQAELGNTIVLAAENFDQSLKDTLGFKVDYSFSNIEIKEFTKSKELNIEIDTISIELNDHAGLFPAFEINNTFYDYDTLNAKTIATCEDGSAIFIKKEIGLGAIYLLSTPKILGNISLLSGDNHFFINEILKELPEGDYIRTEYYTLGRLGHSSTFRVLLERDGLREATQLLLLIILIYLIFEVKREQRAIPTFVPPKNETMQFVDTLGQLYFSQGDNRNILIKRKRYLLDHIKSKYQINLNKENIEEELNLLSFRSGIEEEKIKKLFISLDREIKHSMTEGGFIKVNELIDDFYSKEI